MSRFKACANCQNPCGQPQLDSVLSLDALAERAGAVAAGAAQDVPSPCMSVCCIDPATGWCAGCLRTVDEIAAWSALDNGEKQRVWAGIARRIEQIKA